MSLALISKQKSKAKLAVRDLVQDIAHEREIDPDQVEPTLLLASVDYDTLESWVKALEECLADEAALSAKGYAARIVELTAVRDEAREIRKALEIEQADFNRRWQELRKMEERANHANSLAFAQQAGESEMLNKRRRLLGTTKLDEFPLNRLTATTIVSHS